MRMYGGLIIKHCRLLRISASYCAESATLHSLKAWTVKAAILISMRPFFCKPFGLIGSFPYSIRFRAVSTAMPVRRQYSARGRYGSGMMIVMLGRIRQTPVFIRIRQYPSIIVNNYKLELG